MKTQHQRYIFSPLFAFALGAQGRISTQLPSTETRRYLQQQNNDNETTAITHNTQKKNWWEFGLADPVLDEIALFYLGHVWDQSADVSEVLSTINKVNNTDPWSWTVEWQSLAERIEIMAEGFENEGHKLTAGQTYLRAATYYRAALHRHPDPYADDVRDVTLKEVDVFEKFLKLSDYPCESVRVPYEDTTLPAYVCISPETDGRPAPTVMFNEGKDGWAEDGKYIIDECMKRGYNAVLWDGPGMGKAIRLQGLPFRHDWENVVTPLIDYLLETYPDEVDEEKLALISLSLGGYLGPRAAIFEHRIRALVPNPGVISWIKVYEDALNNIDPTLIALFRSDPETFDSYVEQVMLASDFLHWGFIDSMWHHGKDSASTLMAEIERFNIEETMLQNITAATLVIDAEAEERGQSLQFYNALPESLNKEYLLFTAEEAAQFHDQPGATAILSAKMFNWIDDVFVTTPDPVTTDALDDTSEGVIIGYRSSVFVLALTSLVMIF